MISRILPVDEWPRLEGTEAESIWPLLDPETAQVLVVEHDDAIVGCWVLQPVLHAECLWIAPEHRGKSSVARRLWVSMHQTARELGARTVATSAVSEDVKDLLAHVGAVEVPGELYVMTISEES